MPALRTALATPLVSLSLLVPLAGIALAADLAPKPAPVAADYMRICGSHGPGFYFIPGTDTCLKVGGQVRTDIVVQDNDLFLPFNRRGENTTAMNVRARLDMDARTQTEYGTLRSFTSIVYQRGSRNLTVDPFGASLTVTGVPGAGTLDLGNAPRVQSLPALEVRRAFIQFAGFTVGRDYSFFNLPYFTSFSSPLTSDAIVTTAAYTFESGPLSATIAIEDGTDRRGLFQSYWGVAGAGPLLGIQSNLYAGHAMPDVVGNITITGSMGQFMIAGAVHQIRTLRVPAIPLVAPQADADTEYGFAVQVGGQLYLGPGEGTRRTKIYGGFVYTDGASRYSGLGTDTDRGLNFFEFDASYDFFNRFQTTKIASGHVGAFVLWTPTLSSTVSGSYARVSDSIWSIANQFFGAPIPSHDYDLVRGIANIVWEPIAGFRIGGEVVYDQVNFASGIGLFRDYDTWTGILRIERNF